MDYKQTLSNQRAELLMEDIERDAQILRDIRRAREMPISTEPIKVIGVAVMPFSHYPIDIPLNTPVKHKETGLAMMPFKHYPIDISQVE